MSLLGPSAIHNIYIHTHVYICIYSLYVCLYIYVVWWANLFGSTSYITGMTSTRLYQYFSTNWKETQKVEALTSISSRLPKQLIMYIHIHIIRNTLVLCISDIMYIHVYSVNSQHPILYSMSEAAVTVQYQNLDVERQKLKFLPPPMACHAVGLYRYLYTNYCSPLC